MSGIFLGRRKAIAGLGGLALAGSRGRSAKAATTLRMWTFLDPVNGKSVREVALKKLIDNFEAANPTIRIAVEPQNSRIMSEKFYAAHQTGTAPDIAWILTSRLYGALKLGSLANLDELFVGSWSKEDVADIDGPSWRFGATPNAHYQIPNSAGIESQTYRIDLFREAGIDPKSLTTWDRFFAEVPKLVKKDASGNVTRWAFGQPNAGLAPPAPVIMSVLLDLDGRIFDDKMRAVWSTPAGIRGMQMQVDMIRKYKIMPESEMNMNNEEVYEQFLADRTAINRVTTIRWVTAAQRFGAGKIGYLPTPSFTEGKQSSSEVTGWHIGVWSRTPNREAAAKFVEYLAGKEADLTWSTIAGMVPNRRSTIAENPTFFTDPANAILHEVAEDIRTNGWFPPDGAGAGGWAEGFCAAFQDVMTHNMDPKAALEKAEAAFNRVARP